MAGGCSLSGPGLCSSAEKRFFPHFGGIFPAAAWPRSGFGRVLPGRFAPTHPARVRPVPGGGLHRDVLLRLPEDFCTVPQPGSAAGV